MLDKNQSFFVDMQNEISSYELIKHSLKGIFVGGELVFIYTQGDDMAYVAEWFDVSVEDILAWNSGIENPNTIFPNQKIIIKDKKPIPRKTTVKQPIDNIFIKTYLHFQIGGGKPLNLSASSLNFNGITQKDLIYNPPNNTYSVDLYKVNPTSQTALALGKISLLKVGFNTYSILPDKYDFNIEWHKGFSKRTLLQLEQVFCIME